jgi:putative membrane protein
MLSQADRDRIQAAITDAESRTSGEIYCVVAQQSSKYREAPLAWAAGVALLTPPIALLLGLKPAAAARALLQVVQSGWAVGQAGALDAMIVSALVGYAVLQALLFALVLGLSAIPAVRVMLTPHGLRREHVHARAMEQFAHRLHATRASTGVLIYASLAERQVEVVADEAIHRKVAPGAWDQAVAAAMVPIRAGDVAGGLIAAIETCGRALAEHFPGAGPRPPDEDELVEI